jgi:hypothetical protein
MSVRVSEFGKHVERLNSKGTQVSMLTPDAPSAAQRSEDVLRG